MNTEMSLRTERNLGNEPKRKETDNAEEMRLSAISSSLQHLALAPLML